MTVARKSFENFRKCLSKDLVRAWVYYQHGRETGQKRRQFMYGQGTY